MAALQSNPQLLLKAFLRIAKNQANPTDWLTALQMAALIGTSIAISAVLEKMQDPFATQYSEEGSGSQFIRELPAHLIAELCEAALQQLEAEAAATAAGLTGDSPPGGVRGFDFSHNPCVLG